MGDIFSRPTIRNGFLLHYTIMSGLEWIQLHELRQSGVLEIEIAEALGMALSVVHERLEAARLSRYQAFMVAVE